LAFLSVRCFGSDLAQKLELEQAARSVVVERSEKAEHTISMLELDLKNSQEEIGKLKEELRTNKMKASDWWHHPPWCVLLASSL